MVLEVSCQGVDVDNQIRELGHGLTARRVQCSKILTSDD
jgi:hypothetical protein